MVLMSSAMWAEVPDIGACLAADPEEHIFLLDLKNLDIIDLPVSPLALDRTLDWGELADLSHKGFHGGPDLVLWCLFMQMHEADVFFPGRQ